MEDKKNKEQTKKIKRGVLGERLEELNRIAESLGYPTTLYPQEQRFKKPTKEQMDKVVSKSEGGILQTLKRVIDEVFGEGIVEWKKFIKETQPEKKAVKKNGKSSKS